MKTVEEFIKEIDGSAELQKAFGELKDKASLEAFLKEHGCKATADEFIEFVKPQGEGAIGDDDASAAAGGIIYEKYWKDGRCIFGAGPTYSKEIV